jgi:hypothetical protein
MSLLPSRGGSPSRGGRTSFTGCAARGPPCCRGSLSARRGRGAASRRSPPRRGLLKLLCVSCDRPAQATQVLPRVLECGLEVLDGVTAAASELPAQILQGELCGVERLLQPADRLGTHDLPPASFRPRDDAAPGCLLSLCHAASSGFGSHGTACRGNHCGSRRRSHPGGRVALTRCLGERTGGARAPPPNQAATSRARTRTRRSEAVRLRRRSAVGAV